MPNPYFQFKQFTIYHDRCAMKVTTDACLFGAWAATEMKNREYHIENVLDIGTGTGLLSLMAAQKNNVHIDAIEIDKDAAEQAKENVDASPWQKNIEVFNSDILKFNSNKKYDCIISNPPFYENELASPQQNKNTAHHSVQLTMTQVLDVVKKSLKDDGKFFLLFSFKRIEEIEKLLQQHQLFIIKKMLVKQSVNHQPFRVMIMGTNRQEGEIVSSELSISNESQQYTAEFTNLLKDYYLHL